MNFIDNNEEDDPVTPRRRRGLIHKGALAADRAAHFLTWRRVEAEVEGRGWMQQQQSE